MEPQIFPIATTSHGGGVVFSREERERHVWIVGKSGTIMRTLDRGAHWQFVTPPLHTDFTGVSATDSNNASVVALDRHSYVTHDGGVTWSSQ